MRAVVTGGAGFVGSHVAEALLARGDEVHVLDNLSTGSREKVPDGAELHVGDIRSDAASVFERVRPEVCFHLAAQADVNTSVAKPDFDAEVNVVGTVRLLEATRAADAKMVFTSTGGAIYGECDCARPRGPGAPADLAVRGLEARRRGVPGRLEPAARDESRRLAAGERLRAPAGGDARGRRGRDLLRPHGRGRAGADLRRRRTDSRLRLRARRRGRCARRGRPRGRRAQRRDRRRDLDQRALRHVRAGHRLRARGGARPGAAGRHPAQRDRPRASSGGARLGSATDARGRPARDLGVDLGD